MFSYVVVVNAGEDRVISWQVSVRPEPVMTRLVGAWTSGHVPASKTSAVLLAGQGPTPESVMEMEVFQFEECWKVVLAEQHRLETLNTLSLTKSGAPRAPIEWSMIPDVLTFDTAFQTLPGVTDDPDIAYTLGIARWVQSLADAWAELETIRTSRDHLRGETDHPRTFPGAPGLAEAVCSSESVC
ncbi:hypothetical protein [Gordonia sp. (in: high G+C Gram-positive bacteria)]|uniref:hypothetical protein n=1 Tax=Gordonia sp. (in: high G+C Gram-positive bacteria) TaxID=84139 RepID=UPI001D64B156|nr:hypothetical protein [Gordonia sp. (in: high G+C Gram-positive bacteria)]MCB1293740.1 hypothetical protein [Gordonia sp. (in: high G+C Gram-positive bacteria)]HMS75945.1 hypothetical protein [Gordonia sp. (in: high G+C Gram-positive bacteria)]HQV17580.1 hypothetical protein [Gordonia sp. (in: high G+C Gram-positive bacteria)]